MASNNTPLANPNRPNTRSGSKRQNKSPTDFIPVKSQTFKKSRTEGEKKKISPTKEKMLWALRAETYKQRHGRNLATDSEGEQSETVETAKLLRNLSIPKKGVNTPLPTEADLVYKSPLAKLAQEKPKTVEDLFDVLMPAFKLTNNTIVTSCASLQQQMDTATSAVRTNTRAILKNRRDLMAVEDRVLDLERQQLGNTMLVYNHGLGWEQLKKWSEQLKAIEILMSQALGVAKEDPVLKIVKTEVRLPKERGPGTRIPPIKVFFPSTSAMEYLTTVTQYPSKLRIWHKNENGVRGSLAKFSIKPNVTWWDHQRAIYTRQMVENLRKSGLPSHIKYEATPYGGLRKIENGVSRTIPFEKMLNQYSNFLPPEEGREQRSGAAQQPLEQEQSSGLRRTHSLGTLHGISYSETQGGPHAQSTSSTAETTEAAWGPEVQEQMWS